MGNMMSPEEDSSELYKQYKQNQPRLKHEQQQRDSSIQEDLRDLLRDLDGEFCCYLAQIRSLSSETSDKSVADQLYEIICNVQIRLEGLNWGMYNVHKCATPPPGPDSNIIRRLEDENKELMEKIKLLESEKRHLDGLLTSTMRQRKDDSSRQHFPQTLYSRSQKMEEMEAKIQDKDYEISCLNEVLVCLRSCLNKQQGRIKKLEEEITELSEDNQMLKLRLSEVAGQKKMENNPAIADRSDPNRPTKLGEIYNEIYHNEWSAAFEQLLEAGYTEEECIDTLRLTLFNTLQFCQKKSTKLLEKTQEGIDCLFEELREVVENKEFQKVPKHLTMPRELWKTKERDDVVCGLKMTPSHLETAVDWVKGMRQSSIKESQSSSGEDKSLILLLPKWKAKERDQPQSDEVSGRKKALSHIETSFKQSKDVVKTQLTAFRKEVLESMLHLVQKAYVSASWDEDCLSAMQPYIKKCLLLSWMMVVQSPPLVLDKCETGSRFDTKRYKDYTRSGPKVRIVVLPAILLHDGGPVIGKGVAQGQH